MYNALNGTSYSDPEELEVNTLEDAVYISIKNDISFLVGGTLNLYEHQSTYNPNLPIRGLIYLAHLYEGYIEAVSYTHLMICMRQEQSGMHWEQRQIRLLSILRNRLSDIFWEQPAGWNLLHA